MAREEHQWLVKSSGRILGPFPTAKIAELLRTREVSVLDEVSPPMRRWQTIQYHEEFKEVVDSLRKASLSERTEATWTPSTTSVTQTVTDVADSDLTEEITGDLSGFTNTAKEIVIHNVDEKPDRPQAGSGAGRYQPQFGRDTSIQRQVDKTTRGLWIVTAVVLIGVAAFIMQKRVRTGELQVKPSVQSLKQTIVDLTEMGRYAEALKELKAYYPDPMQAGELSIYYGSLLVQVEGQTVLGRRLLSSVSGGARRPDSKQVYTGLGLADLIDRQLDSAIENFDKALAQDAEYVPAIVNKASVYVQRGDYAQAKTLATRALSLSPLQGEALLVLAEAQLYLFNRGKNVAELTQVSRALKEFLAKQWNYRAELGFYSLYFDFLKRDRMMEDKIQEYLDTDPRLTADHRYNVFIYRGRADWKILARLCEQIAEQLGDSARVATFQASCHMREARWDAARRQIERAVHQAPKDPLIQAWYSHILRESGDADQASVILGRSTEFNRKGEYVLPVLLQARFCQKLGDVACARQAWTRLFERDLEYLPAIAGLAWVNTQLKSNAEAAKLTAKGLRISPDYIPLLELRYRGEKEGWNAK